MGWQPLFSACAPELTLGARRTIPAIRIAPANPATIRHLRPRPRLIGIPALSSYRYRRHFPSIRGPAGPHAFLPARSPTVPHYHPKSSAVYAGGFQRPGGAQGPGNRPTSDRTDIRASPRGGTPSSPGHGQVAVHRPCAGGSVHGPICVPPSSRGPYPPTRHGRLLWVPTKTSTANSSTRLPRGAHPSAARAIPAGQCG